MRQVRTKKKKLLFVGEFPPHAVNGVANMNKQYLSELRNFLDCTIVIDRTERPFYKRHIGLFYKVICSLQKNNFDFLYVNLPTSYFGLMRTLLLVILCSLRCKEVKLHLHRGDILNLKKLPFTLMLRLFREKIDIILLDVRFEQKIRQLIPNIRTCVVPNHIAKPLLHTSKKFTLSTKNIIFFSNLFVSKGIGDFIEVARHAYNTGANAQFKIYGNEFGEVDFNNIPPNCIYKGNINKTDEKMRLFRDASVLLFPSENEGIPLVVLEAMSAGVPIVCHRIDGTESLLGRDYPYFSEIRSSSSLWQKLDLLLGCQVQEYEALCKNLIDRYEKKFNKIISIKKFTRIFDD